MPSPQQVNWAKFRALSVILAGLLILGTLVVLLTGGTLMRPKSTVYLYLPDATGVAAGSPVRVDGIGVGKVTSVELSGSNQPDRVVKVAMTIYTERLASITRDSTAETTSDTMIGDQFIDITSGTSGVHLNAGGEIQYKGGADLMQRLDLAQFQQRLRAIQLVLDDVEQGKGPLGAFLNGDDLYNELRKKVSDLQGSIHAAADTTSAVGHALYTDELYRKVMDPLRQLDQSLASCRRERAAAAHCCTTPNSTSRRRRRRADLRHSIEGLRGGELMRSDAAYVSWQGQVESILQKVADFDASPAMATSAVYDNLAGMAKELQTTTRDFRENPRKYLRVKLF